MKALFIGGTGNISSACTAFACAQGIDVCHLNRGIRAASVPKGVKTLRADIGNPQEVRNALGNETFDTVVDWIAFTPDHVRRDIDLFNGRTKQFIFISSASVYQKPLTHPIVAESTPACNPFWTYAQNKIACEQTLTDAYRASGFPMTIVRPSYTYDTVIPVAVGNWNFTVPWRMRQGRKIIVHGDGTSLWTMTHASDFAKGFNGLLGNVQSIGHTFHITSDEVLTWNQIYRAIGAAAGVEPELIHIPSDFINAVHPSTGAGLLGDKAHSAIFDNTKIRRFVPGFVATTPFSEGIKRTIAWFEEKAERMTPDVESDRMMDGIVERYEKR